MNQLKQKIHHNINLQQAWDKYGEDNFVFGVIESSLDESSACAMEEKLINENMANKCSFNIGISSIGGDNLTCHPNKDVISKKIAAEVTKRLSRMTNEEKAKAFGKPGEMNPMFGKHHSDKAKLAISKANTGNKYALGAKRTQECKDNMSKIASERTGELNPFFGKTHSQETRRKLSKANAGKKPINRRAVIANGIEYQSVTDAAKDLSVSPMTVIFRIKSKYWDFQYA